MFNLFSKEKVFCEMKVDDLLKVLCQLGTLVSKLETTS